MGIRCSIFGCEYDGTEVERDETRRGSEVVLTVREYETCARCDNVRLVSENTEVTAVGDATDDRADEEFGSPGSDGIVGTRDEEGGSTPGPDGEGIAGAGNESSAGTSSGSVAGTGPADAGPVTDDAVILTDEPDDPQQSGDAGPTDDPGAPGESGVAANAPGSVANDQSGPATDQGTDGDELPDTPTAEFEVEQDPASHSESNPDSDTSRDPDAPATEPEDAADAPAADSPAVDRTGGGDATEDPETAEVVEPADGGPSLTEAIREAEGEVTDATDRPDDDGVILDGPDQESTGGAGPTDGTGSTGDGGDENVTGREWPSFEADEAADHGDDPDLAGGFPGTPMDGQGAAESGAGITVAGAADSADGGTVESAGSEAGSQAARRASPRSGSPRTTEDWTTAGGGDAGGELYCPECSSSWSLAETAHRAGDGCPSCSRGYLAER